MSAPRARIRTAAPVAATLALAAFELATFSHPWPIVAVQLALVALLARPVAGVRGAVGYACAALSLVAIAWMAGVIVAFVIYPPE